MFKGASVRYLTDILQVPWEWGIRLSSTGIVQAEEVAPVLLGA
jgi:hypothetical protein